MKIGSIRAIKDGNVNMYLSVPICHESKIQQVIYFISFNSEKHKCHFAMAKAAISIILFFF